MARRELEYFRGYLSTLARIHFHRDLQARVDPEDVVQQTMLEAHASAKHFRGSTEAEQAAWLRRILAANLSNLSRDHRRACRDVKRELPIADFLDQSSRALVQIVAADQPSPSSLFEKQDQMLRVAGALAELPTEEQDVIVLRCCEGLSLIDIGTRLDVSTKTVARRLRRGISTLRERLSPSVEGSDG